MNIDAREIFAKTTSDDDTKQFAGRVAQKIVSLLGKDDSRNSSGWIIVLNGTLGSGKTRFAQGFLEALGVEQEVVSPTFVLVVPYETRGPRVAHLDLFRIEHAEEIDDLGLDELRDDGCILLIEWGEKFLTAIPPPDLTVNMTVAGDCDREILLVASSPKGESLVKQLRCDSAEHDTCS